MHELSATLPAADKRTEATSATHEECAWAQHQEHVLLQTGVSVESVTK